MSSRWWTLFRRDGDDGKFKLVSVSSRNGAWSAYEQAKWLAANKGQSVYMQGPNDQKPSSVVSPAGIWTILRRGGEQ
jgi:hypothetical protein